MSREESKSLFDRIYTGTAEVLKLARKPFVYNKNKRALESAIDSAEDQKMTAEGDILKELERVIEGEVVDVNKVLGYKQKIKNAEETILVLTAFKEEFLGKE